MKYFHWLIRDVMDDARDSLSGNSL